MLGITRGELPIRYLGVPLSSKRLSIIQCQPLLDKMVGRITSWTSRLLSYAGRLQLIKSVLFSIQIYWSQLFLLPKKLVYMIEQICRTFLWTGNVDVSKRALLAWEKICMPKASSGMNLLNIHLWNKAALCKLLWKLSKKKDILWVKWIHMYYGKGESMWDKIPKQACWMIQKVFKAKLYIEEAGMTKEDLLSCDSFSTKKIYLQLLGQYTKVAWRRLICNNPGSPKWLFIVNLVARGRLYTRHRLAQWGWWLIRVAPSVG